MTLLLVALVVWVVRVVRVVLVVVGMTTSAADGRVVGRRGGALNGEVKSMKADSLVQITVHQLQASIESRKRINP